jgi:nucleotide-binding universal stress UspA family protein
MRGHRILVPTDFSPAAEMAFDTAIELARAFAGTVVLMHTYGIPSYAYPGLEGLAAAEFMTALERAARDALNKAVVARKGVEIPIATALYCGVPWEQILLAVREHEIGLVVMGTHGRRGIAHALLGSVAERIVRMSPVPVLTVRPPEQEAQET